MCVGKRAVKIATVFVQFDFERSHILGADRQLPSIADPARLRDPSRQASTIALITMIEPPATLIQSGNTE